MIIKNRILDLETPTGTMRCYEYRPVENGNYPAIIYYSEIFQQTAPIARAAAIMAGHGFIVLVPEVFHELNPIGTVLAYDDEGKDKGNADKFAKPLEHHDSDTQAMIDHLLTDAQYNGHMGTMGVCIGGHLAFRAALNPSVEAAFCLYATDIHSNTLLCQNGNDSLSRAKDIQGELVLIFGKQDPHVPTEGRQAIYQQLIDEKVNFSWHEVNGQHAFMRDEGERYDPELALKMYADAVALFRRVLR